MYTTMIRPGRRISNERNREITSSMSPPFLTLKPTYLPTLHAEPSHLSFFPKFLSLLIAQSFLQPCCAMCRRDTHTHTYWTYLQIPQHVALRRSLAVAHEVFTLLCLSRRQIKEGKKEINFSQ